MLEYKKLKTENLKTEYCFNGHLLEMEFGKPVKLPNIKRQPHIQPPRHSIDQKDAHSFSKKRPEKDQSLQRNNFRQTYLNATASPCSETLTSISPHTGSIQLDLLNFQETQKTQRPAESKHLPKITPCATRLNTERLARIKSEKNINVVESLQAIGNYRLGSIIGRGSYAIVRVGKFIDPKSEAVKKYAVKTYPKSKIGDPQRRVNLERQISIMKMSSHPNLIAFVESIHTEDSIHIVMQLLDNMSLADVLKGEVKQLSEDNCRWVIKAVGGALAYLHARNVVHRDLKMENILVTSTQRASKVNSGNFAAARPLIKLIDLGFAVELNDPTEILYDFCGTPNYMAPQVVHRHGYYGKQADVWSLGVLLYRLSQGCFPFRSMNEKGLFMKITKGDYHAAEGSSDLQRLIDRMLKPHPQQRPTCEQILSDKWTLGSDIKSSQM